MKVIIICSLLFSGAVLARVNPKPDEATLRKAETEWERAFKNWETTYKKLVEVEIEIARANFEFRKLSAQRVETARIETERNRAMERRRKVNSQLSEIIRERDEARARYKRLLGWSESE